VTLGVLRADLQNQSGAAGGDCRGTSACVFWELKGRTLPPIVFSRSPWCCQAFATFDEDGSGSITREELSAALGLAGGLEITPELLDAMIEEASSRSAAFTVQQPCCGTTPDGCTSLIPTPAPPFNGRRTRTEMGN